jgi:hypothetical protein
MNERMQELYDQAFTLGTSGYSNGELDVEKFAQLIVKDCLYIVEPMEDSGDEWCVTLKGTAQAIKEHFGVEK